MSNPGEADSTPIESVRQLAEWLEGGCKPREAWRIGTEHEKFGFRTADLRPPPYEPQGIRAMLEGLAGPGWSPVLEDGNPIALKGQGRWDGASVSLEPGGQFELSGAPVADLHATQQELTDHAAEVRRVAAPLGLGFAPLGFHPLMKRADIPVMPKGRYAIMRRYMERTGQLGLDMMLRTCTVQVNLDFGSEADMVRKLRVSLLLQSLATALFASSPFVEGRPSGFLSSRAHVWTDTDPDRTGIPPVVFEDGFGFERYAEWLLDVPMYFVLRNGRYVDLAGRSFRSFMTGAYRDEVGTATLGDFADHVTTVFPDVRLKRFLEMRGADAGSLPMMLAQSALWVGLLYDDAALAAAESLVARHPWREFAALRDQVPTLGLGAPWGGGTLRDLAAEVVGVARDGLRARAAAGALGPDESAALEPLERIVAGGPTQAEALLEHYQGDWAGDAGRALVAGAI